MEPADPDGVLYMGYGVLVLLLPMMSRREWWPARRKHQQRQLRRRRISTALQRICVRAHTFNRGVEESNCSSWESSINNFPYPI